MMKKKTKSQSQANYYRRKWQSTQKLARQKNLRIHHLLLQVNDLERRLDVERSLAKENISIRRIIREMVKLELQLHNKGEANE